MKAFYALLLLSLGAGADLLAKDDPVFSGPQPGEKLPPFKIRGVLEPEEGKEIDPVTRADGKPILLIFVNDMNRQSLMMTRSLTGYAKTRQMLGLTSTVVWIGQDATDAENTLKRVQRSLTPGVTTGVSPEGREGPGSYGLNRKVALTVLVGNKGKVTANFALIQPSAQADLPRILEAVAKELGEKAPPLRDVPGTIAMTKPDGPDGLNETLRRFMAQLSPMTAQAEEVESAARRIEDFCATSPSMKKEIGRMANMMVESGKLESYGTPKAREYLKKWAKEYAAKKKEEKAPAEKSR